MLTFISLACTSFPATHVHITFFSIKSFIVQLFYLCFKDLKLWLIGRWYLVSSSNLQIFNEEIQPNFLKVSSNKTSRKNKIFALLTFTG